MSAAGTCVNSVSIDLQCQLRVRVWTVSVLI